MDPNEILSEQDSVIYLDASWNKSTTPKPGFLPVKVHTVAYGDGRIIRTALNDDGSVLGQLDTTYDAERKKIYDEAVKNATPIGGRPEIPINGRRMGWDPRTRDYTVDLGPVQTPASTDPGAIAADQNAVELQRQRERNAALPKEQDPAYETDAERRARGRQTVLDQGAAADKAAAAQRQATADAAAAEAKNRPTISYKKIGTKTYKVLTYPDGREEVSESALPADVPDDQITTVNGQPARVVRDANGRATGLEVLPISGQGTDPTFTGAPPPWVPKAVQDDLTAYSKQLQDAVASGAITPQRASQLMEARYKSAQAAVDNQLDASKSIYGAGVTERGQDVSLANERLRISQEGTKSGLDFFKEVNPWLKKGSTSGADAFLAIRNMAYQDAQRYGGLNEIPRTPIPAALQSAANSITITSPDGTTVTVPHGAGAAAPSPAAPAAPAMPQPSPDLPAPQPNLAQQPQPTGFAAIDQYSQQIDSGMPTTVTGMEDALRRNGLEEDAIAASRRNLLGAA